VALSEEKSQSRESDPTSLTRRYLRPPSPGHPIQAALYEAICKRWDEAIELFNGMQGLKLPPKNTQKAESMMESFAALLSDCAELSNWYLGDDAPVTRERADEVAKSMLEAGWPASEALNFAKSIQRRSRKRPADKRRSAIAALELLLADARLTWRELAKRTYGCTHEKSCKCGEHLRREVGHVKRFLARMRISLPLPPRK
jgi:hypothetical protein